MRKCLILLLVLAMLCPFSASAAEAPKYVILAFDGFPAGAPGRELLTGLAQRNIRATFFLWNAPWEQGRRVLNEKHEIGLLLPASLNTLSRRQVASHLRGAQALLPPCRIRFLMADKDCSDGVRQVAGALHFSLEKAVRQPWKETLGNSSVSEEIKSGDTVYLQTASRSDVLMALRFLDLLRSRGFRLVTASEFARLQRLS